MKEKEANVTESPTPSIQELRKISFKFISSKASKVEIIGDFNNWLPEQLEKKEKNVWEIIKYLPPGTYVYNFIVDEKVITNPYVKETTDTGKGFLSSVITVHPLEQK